MHATLARWTFLATSLLLATGCQTPGSWNPLRLFSRNDEPKWSRTPPDLRPDQRLPSEGASPTQVAGGRGNGNPYGQTVENGSSGYPGSTASYNSTASGAGRSNGYNSLTGGTSPGAGGGANIGAYNTAGSAYGGADPAATNPGSSGSGDANYGASNYGPYGDAARGATRGTTAAGAATGAGLASRGASAPVNYESDGRGGYVRSNATRGASSDYGGENPSRAGADRYPVGDRWGGTGASEGRFGGAKETGLGPLGADTRARTVDTVGGRYAKDNAATETGAEPRVSTQKGRYEGTDSGLGAGADPAGSDWRTNARSGSNRLTDRRSESAASDRSYGVDSPYDTSSEPAGSPKKKYLDDDASATRDASPDRYRSKSDADLRENDYRPGASDYDPGKSGYRAGETDYEPGRTGYDPPGATQYKGPAKYDDGRGAREPKPAPYRPGSTRGSANLSRSGSKAPADPWREESASATREVSYERDASENSRSTERYRR